MQQSGEDRLRSEIGKSARQFAWCSVEVVSRKDAKPPRGWWSRPIPGSLLRYLDGRGQDRDATAGYPSFLCVFAPLREISPDQRDPSNQTIRPSRRIWSLAAHQGTDFSSTCKGLPALCGAALLTIVDGRFDPSRVPIIIRIRLLGIVPPVRQPCTFPRERSFTEVQHAHPPPIVLRRFSSLSPRSSASWTGGSRWSGARGLGGRSITANGACQRRRPAGRPQARLH